MTTVNGNALVDGLASMLTVVREDIAEYQIIEQAIILLQPLAIKISENQQQKLPRKIKTPRKPKVVKPLPETSAMKVFNGISSIQAALEIKEILNRGDKPGYVWRRTDGRIKVAGEDYGAGPNEVLIGCYDPMSKAEDIAADIEAAV